VNKREIDQIIHKIVSVRYKDRPAAWKEVKKRIMNDQEGFVAALKTEWKKHA